MKRLHFTDQAEDSLAGIARWTADAFGPRQADIYNKEVLDRCISLAKGLVPSRSCRFLLSSDLAEDMRYAQIGGHIVVFVETASELVVMDFFNQREDWLGKIALLGRS